MKLVRVVMTGSVFGFFRHGGRRAIAVRVPSMRTPLREVDYVAGNGSDAPAWAIVAHDIRTDDRKSPARMAAAPAHEPARARHGGGHLDAAPELPRDRTLVAVTRHGAASRRAPRCPAARAQRAARRRRLRAGLHGAVARRSGAGRRAQGRRPRARRARAVSGARDRPPLDTG